MTHIHTAIGEILRTGIDALRGLGYSFALADRATHMLAWAEAVNGSGLRFIHAHEAAIHAAMPRSFGWTDGAAPGMRTGGRLDASGRCVLEVGPRALDLADAGARTDGVGLVLVRNALGSVFLPELAAYSTERGLGVLMLYGGAESGALLGLPSGGEAQVLAIQGRPADDLGSLVARIAGADAAAAVRQFLSGDDEGGDLSKIVFLSFDPARLAEKGLPPQELARQYEACAGEGVVDLGARWRQAVAHGFEIDAQDWAYLYTLVGRTRVVTSERSRQQAG